MKYQTPEIRFISLAEEDRILSMLASGESPAFGKSVSWDEGEIL